MHEIRFERKREHDMLLFAAQNEPLKMDGEGLSRAVCETARLSRVSSDHARIGPAQHHLAEGFTGVGGPPATL